MSRIALVSDTDEIVRVERADRIDQTAGVRSGYRWLPVEQDDVDTSTPDNEFVTTERTGPVVEATRVVYTRTTRDMTTQEADAVKNGRVSTLLEDPLFRVVVGDVLFEVVNDVRVLKGQQPVTAQQFRNYIRGKL